MEKDQEIGSVFSRLIVNVTLTYMENNHSCRIWNCNDDVDDSIEQLLSVECSLVVSTGCDIEVTLLEIL